MAVSKSQAEARIAEKVREEYTRIRGTAPSDAYVASAVRQFTRGIRDEDWRYIDVETLEAALPSAVFSGDESGQAIMNATALEGQQLLLQAVEENRPKSVQQAAAQGDVRAVEEFVEGDPEDDDGEPQTPEEAFGELNAYNQSGLSAASKLLQRPVTAREYERAKSIFDEGFGGETTPAQFLDMVTSGSQEAVMALNIATGWNDQTRKVVRAPNGKSYEIDMDVYNNAILELTGAQKYRNVFNKLVADRIDVSGESEWAWAPLLADTHKVFTGPVRQKKEGLVGWLQDRLHEVDQFHKALESQALMDKFNGYVERFGKENQLAALVATHDEELAEKMMGEGIDDQDAYKLFQIFGTRNIDQKLEKLGLFSDGIQRYTAEFRKLQRASQEGPKIPRPDRTKIGEGFRELFRAWFRMEPEEGELEEMISTLEGQYMSAARAGNQFDFDSRMKERARSSDLYARLFANRPTGVSEEEYVNQFNRAGSQLLGGEVAPDAAVQAGMQFGSTQTTVGAVAGSKQAWDNSSFRERVARAAEIINRLT